METAETNAGDTEESLYVPQVSQNMKIKWAPVTGPLKVPISHGRKEKTMTSKKLAHPQASYKCHTTGRGAVLFVAELLALPPPLPPAPRC